MNPDKYRIIYEGDNRNHIDVSTVYIYDDVVYEMFGTETFSNSTKYPVDQWCRMVSGDCKNYKVSIITEDEAFLMML